MSPAPRRIGDFYAPAWEAVPLLLVAAVLVHALAVVAPAVAAAGEPVGLQVMFIPIMALLFYIAATFGGWLAVRVEDPARDVNWLLVRINPARVMADPAAKERYLGTVVRTLFLVKAATLLALLAAQVWLSLPR